MNAQGKAKGSHDQCRNTSNYTRRFRYLMLSNQGFHSVDVLRNWFLIPLDEGGLGPLDPCQKFLQELGVSHQF